MANDQSFVQSVLSSPGGTGSTSRVCTLLLVLSAIAWVTFLVIRNHAIPDLSNLSLWLATTTGSTYGVNKLANVIGNRKAAQSA